MVSILSVFEAGYDYPTRFLSLSSRNENCDYYTGCTQESVRNTILKQFSIDDSCLRALIATVAFSLGVNCSNVRHDIHFGVPEYVETYVQVGRAG